MRQKIDFLKRPNTVACILTGILAGGITYWLNPYNVMQVGGVSVYKILFSGVFLGSFLLALLTPEKIHRIAILVCTGVTIAVIGRIFIDIIADPGTHNLFPFEILVALFITVPSAFIGAYTSKFIKRSIIKETD